MTEFERLRQDIANVRADVTYNTIMLEDVRLMLYRLYEHVVGQQPDINWIGPDASDGT